MWNINELFWTLLDIWKLLLASAELKDLRITLEFYQNCAQHWLWKEAHKLYVLYLAYNIFYTMLVMKFKNGIHYTGACTVCTVWAALFLCVVIWIVQTPRHRGEVIDCSPLHSQPRDTRGTTWHTHSWDLQALFNAGSLIFQRTLFMPIMYIFPYCLWTSRYSLVVPKVSLFESFYPGASDIKHNDLPAHTFFQPKLFGGRSFFCPYFEFKLSVSDKCILRELIYAFFMCFWENRIVFYQTRFYLAAKSFNC